MRKIAGLRPSARPWFQLERRVSGGGFANCRFTRQRRDRGYRSRYRRKRLPSGVGSIRFGGRTAGIFCSTIDCSGRHRLWMASPVAGSARFVPWSCWQCRREAETVRGKLSARRIQRAVALVRTATDAAGRMKLPGGSALKGGDAHRVLSYLGLRLR